MMTNREMRVRLAQAMGWTDLETVSPCGRMRGLWGSEPAGWFCPGSPARSGIIVPDPLEDDCDAARLRAWCARRGWRITCCHDEGAAWWRVSDLRCQGPRAESMVDAKEEPDYCRRERVALCRAVLRAIEVQP
jgi:hypothetical protein